MKRKFAYLPTKVYDQNDKKNKTIWLKYYWRFLDSGKEGLMCTNVVIYKQNQIAWQQEEKAKAKIKSWVRFPSS